MTRKEWISLSLVLLLASVLRFWGIGHNVWIDENKVINSSITMAQSEGFPLLVAPQSYYPHFTHHVLALVFWPIAKMSPDFSNEQFHFVARAVAALFNIATVGIVYVIGRRLLGHWGGILAALFLAVMPLHVKYSHFMQVDLIATFFMTLALWGALKIWDEGETRWYFLTGIFVGAAGASQFWGFTAGAALLLAHVGRLAGPHFAFAARGRPGRAIIRPAFLGALLLIPITFTALSPHLVLQWNEKYRETFGKIQMRGAAGDLGYTRANILWPLYTRSPDWGLNFTRAGLMWESNVAIFALAAFGAVMAVWKKNWKVLLMLGVFALVLYLAINGALRLYAVKRLMPLGPLLALLAAYGVVRLPRWRTLVQAVATVAVVAALFQTIGFDMAYAKGSVHEQAVRWARANIPHGKVVLQHGPLKLLEPDSEEWEIVRMNEVYASFSAHDPEVAKDRAKPLEQWIAEEGVDFVVLDSRMVDRYYDSTSMKLYPETTASYRAFYDDIRTRGELAYNIGPEFGKQAGARVEIYDVRKLALSPDCLNTDLDQHIKVRTVEDAAAVRKAAIDYIWSGDGFPTRQPDQVTPDVGKITYLDASHIENLGRIDQLDITLDQGFNSRVYHFVPKKGNNRLVIFHQGHGHDLKRDGAQETIELFLQQGYAVLGFHMPESGPNEGPVPGRDTEAHNNLQALESDSFNPMEIFLEPVAVALNYTDQHYQYKDVTMIGISGGGWTTEVYTALDPRITYSFPVAGSYPRFLRASANPGCDTKAGDDGDYEQGTGGMAATFYSEIASYLDLYVLSSVNPGRVEVQIYNKSDPCCFEGVRYRVYRDLVARVVSDLSGGKGVFQVVLDTTHDSHMISDWAREQVMLSILGE